MIKKLMKSIREFKGVSIATPILVACEVGLEVAIPTLMSMLIDYGINESNMDYVVKMGLFLVLCALVSLFSGRWQVKLLQRRLPALPEI